jgi:hypothetical protein
MKSSSSTSRSTFSPLLTLESIACYPINFQPKRYPKVADLELRQELLGILCTITPTSPGVARVEATVNASAAVTNPLVSSDLHFLCDTI